MSVSVLTVQNLTKKFRSGWWPFTNPYEYVAVNDISFSVNEKEILGFLGPNGAGKTTTIQMLLGTLTPTSGSIHYFGQDFATNRYEILKKARYASGYDSLPPQLTILENLDIIGRIYGLSKTKRAEQIEQLLKLFDMWNMRNKETGTLSAGQATRVMLVKAFLGDPQLVLLDEPTASLDPDIAQEVRQFILEQNKTSGMSILVTSHNMDEVTEMCDRVLVLKKGRIIASDTPENLAASIAQARINLIITQEYDALVHYLENKGLSYIKHEHSVEVLLDEHAIAHFLSDIAKHHIIYSHISIDKPTLEDYFLSVAK
ncbi:MAG TPA: ABC transporter ATP-binding protein [Candidatus Babeliales bacterium]|jgi:ABC-2 type transport system ATP-binding protein|nr:ABC transporter ATP-binding protein [Candidatus Babeliales bacterium]